MRNLQIPYVAAQPPNETVLVVELVVLLSVATLTPVDPLYKVDKWAKCVFPAALGTTVIGKLRALTFCSKAFFVPADTHLRKLRILDLQ